MWRSWPRGSRWIVSLGGALVLVGAAAATALHYSLSIPRVPLPAGVSKRTERFALTGTGVAVDFYLPSNTTSAPVVVLAHGFSRNRKTMAGWGGELAQGGFIVAVPDLPSWADHVRNGQALVELLGKLQTGKLVLQPVPSGRAALVGFSAGGFSTLLAAAGNTNVNCWVGLDPVAMGGAATKAAQSLSIPSFVLRAEPAPWNANGNARGIFAALPGPAFSLVVKQATHVDAEHPTSRAAEWACGKSDPARREVFGRYLLAGLRSALLRDESAWRQLATATNDPAVREVTFRKLEEFRSTP